ncbi:MAG TPA: DNA polymerase III subunit delta, partial [Gemmatimonadaceae bacterium]
ILLGMSPAADIKALRAASKDKSFAAAYYLYGEDDYVKHEEVRRLIDASVDPATRDFNFETLRGPDVDAETLGSTLSTPPMMADRRVVVVRDVTGLKKDARAMLDKYLKRPAPDLVLILVAPSEAKADKGLIGSTTAVEFKPLEGSRIPKWIAYYVEHDLGATITEGAITLLQEAAGTELAQLKLELDKLGAFTDGGPINEAAVAAVVGIRPGETMGDLLDAVARRDAKAALAMLPAVFEQPKTAAVPIVMALTVQTLGIGWAQSVRERGGRPDMFSLLKETGAFTFRSWSEFSNTCSKASNQWSPDAIDDALVALLETDVALKTTKLSSDEQIIANLVLSLCGVRPRRRAA